MAAKRNGGWREKHGGEGEKSAEAKNGENINQ